MEQNKINSTEENSGKIESNFTNESAYSSLNIGNLIPGMVIGILLGVVIILVYQKNLPDITQTLFKVTIISFGVLVLSFILIYAFKKQITKFFFGIVIANSSEIIDDAQKLTDGFIGRFSNSLLRGVSPDVLKRIQVVIPRLMNWFIWNRFRNWWWQWLLGVFISLGGLTGTLLLVNQNELLQNQNELLQNQNVLIQRQMPLEEANRRSALVVLMSSVLDKADREIESQQKKQNSPIPKNSRYTLSMSVIGQIVALSHSFKPYRFMEGDSLINFPLSPERALLLTTICLLPLDSSTKVNIYRNANFKNSNLENAKLTSADLSMADLERSNLREADLRIVNFTFSNLKEADLSSSLIINTLFIQTNLSQANLSRAKLTSSFLFQADLYKANLNNAILFKANLSGADLREAILKDTDLSGAILKDTDLRRADLSGADLSGADLSGANFYETKNLTIQQLSKCKTLFKCLFLNDSLSLPLIKSHTYLFIDPDKLKGN